MRIVIFALTVASLALAAGCEEPQKVSLTEQVQDLQQQNQQLASELEQAGSEKQQLKTQIQTLSGLDPQIRLENLYDVQKVKVTKYTNLYDKDKDGKREKLIVYLQPQDEQGDIVKASGSVDVELWDLNREQSKAMIAKWHVSPEELKELWFAAIVTINYRLTFDVGEFVETYEQPLTVKVTFTDYLSGKIFKEQKVIKP